MPDILIRGMEIPKNCAECPCISQWDDCEINHEWKFADEFDKTKDRLPSCPLISLPEGHGRLGDLDALMNNIGDVPYKGAVRRVLMSAPTIVPAEGGVEE